MPYHGCTRKTLSNMVQHGATYYETSAAFETVSLGKTEGESLAKYFSFFLQFTNGFVDIQQQAPPVKWFFSEKRKKV